MMCVLPMAFVRTQSDNRVLWVTKAFHATRAALQVSQKAIAIDLKMDEPHLSKQLNCDGLNLHRLVLLGRVFWRVFLPLLAEIVDCADLLVNPIAAETARDLAHDVKVLRAELAQAQQDIRQLMAERRVSA